MENIRGDHLEDYIGRLHHFSLFRQRRASTDTEAKKVPDYFAPSGAGQANESDASARRPHQ